MSSVRHVTMGAAPNPGSGPAERPFGVVDLYDLDEGLLFDGEVKGLMLSMNCDQVFLERRSKLLEKFVCDGGRVLVNGHVLRPFLPGLSRWHAIDHHGPDDLDITPVSPHPVWEGVDYDELLFRTGFPGTPVGEELARVGVAGFYGRGHHSQVPSDGTVINGIGPYRLPVDITYPLGDGAVLAHAGNDLYGFSDPDRTTRTLGPRLISWLEGTL